MLKSGFLMRGLLASSALVALGDSIMVGWREADLAGVFKGSVNNLGFGGDGAEHLLWRLESFNWSKQNPKYVLVLVGTNDMHFPQCAVEVGLPHLIVRLKQVFPKAQLIVTAILPRGPNFLEADNVIRAVNAELAAHARSGGYWFFNPHDSFTCEHRPTCELFQFQSANRHLTPEGYALLTKLLAQFVASKQPKP